MNKKNIFTLITGLVVICSFSSSCEDIIDVDLRSVEPELVIEGSIRMGDAAEVLITKTKDFGDSNDYPPVTGVMVSISDDTGHSETLQRNAQGRYVAATIIGTERTTYYLSVKYEGREYTSTSYMPPKVEIDSLTVWKMPVKDYADPRVHFKDPIGEENQYYRYKIYINDGKPSPNDRLEDRLISTEYVDGGQITLPVFIRYVNGGRDDDPIGQGDKITVEMQCLDKDVYTFFETLHNSEDALANPIGNIKGGALGYFSAYSYTSKDIVMEWE